MFKPSRLIIVFGLLVWFLFLFSVLHSQSDTAATGATFVVDSRQDEPDDDPGDGVCATYQNKCTFRAALDEANAQSGANQIHFNIRNGSDCPGSAITIEANPDYFVTLQDGHRGSYVIKDNWLTIDAYTQCGSRPNNQATEGNAVIRIELTPREETDAFGLVFNANNNVVKGLSIYGWERNVEFRDAAFNKLTGSFIGMKASGSDGNGYTGIRINYGSSHNTIGGDTPAERNILSGNRHEALDIQGAGVTQNHVIGNYIGLKQNGTSSLPNGGDAVDIAERASNNWVGGILLNNQGQPILDDKGRYIADPNKRNVISGNEQDGVEISHHLLTQYNQVVGNWIGVDVYGQELSNGENGVTLEDQVNNNHIYQNVISGNSFNGVRFYTVNNNYLYDNWIGLLPNGTARPNGVGNSDSRSGVFLMGGSRGNQIFRNYIAYNKEYGIYINTEAGYLAEPKNGGYGNCDTMRNTFSRNFLYGNDQQGIRLKSGSCTYVNGNPIDHWTHYPNENIQKPTITQANTAAVMGTSDCSKCTVEVFIVAKPDSNDFGRGEGKTFIGASETGPHGNFMVQITGAKVNDEVTATVTDEKGNTSEFSLNQVVVTAPPQPTPLPTPTQAPLPTPPPPQTADVYVYIPLVVRAR